MDSQCLYLDQLISLEKTDKCFRQISPKPLFRLAINPGTFNANDKLRMIILNLITFVK